MPKRRPSFDSKRFASVIADAGGQIAAGLRRATLIDHHPTSGSIRETGLRDFLRQVLPDRYYVGTGFAFDAQDTESRQLDVVIALEPPLSRVFEKETICYLPCEVVLAAIEVKKTLDSEEVRGSLRNAGSVRSLKPYGTQEFTSARQRGARLEATQHRCFYSVVAFSSDLSESCWAQREWDRLKLLSAELNLSSDVIDRVVILDRGQINSVEGTSSDGGGNVEKTTTQWFIHLSNHLDREASRRPPFDPDIYTVGKPWNRLT